MNPEIQTSVPQFAASLANNSGPSDCQSHLLQAAKAHGIFSLHLVADPLKHAPGWRGGGLVILGLMLLMGGQGMTSAAPSFWLGAGGDASWSNIANWSGGLPLTSTDVVFATNGVVTDSSFNNALHNASLVQSLHYQHTNASSGAANMLHNTYINEGATLTISTVVATNALFVGSGLALANTKTTASISGTNGSLIVVATNGVFNVRQGGIQNISGLAALDLSGLSNLTVRARSLLVAGDGSNAGATLERDRASGSLKLARNNFITLNGSSFPPAMTIGRNIGNGGFGASLTMGQTNFFLCDAGFGVGIGRSVPSVMTFGGFPNAFARFRNSAGTGPQQAWLIGDCVSVTYSGNTNAGVVDFSGGAVDADVSLVVIGRAVNDTKGLAGGSTEGCLSLDAGLLKANTIILGYQVNSYAARAGGTLNVDGSAQVTVNNEIQLGRFMAAAASNGVSSAVLNIGTRSGGGSVLVNGGIVTVPNAASTNDSRIVIRNGGSLVVKGSIGPLLVLELNDASLKLDFGNSTNPTTPVCAATNLITAAPVALTIAGSRLANGQITLFKYKTLGGAGFAGFSSVTFSNQLAGYLSNNIANSSIDLVITQSNPGTSIPSPVTPRLTGRPIYADYAKVLLEATPRADGLTHIDTPALIQRLLAGNIKTYAFLCWNTKYEWDDFRLEFLPAAHAAGIDVYLYLTPPTENSPPAGYTPFAEDYYSWMTEAARLSLHYPRLKAVVLDDFNSNLGLFTPDYVRRITEAAHTINSNLMFMVINYDLTKGWASPTSYTSPAFMKSYGPYLSAVMFAYLNWPSHDDYSDEAYQLTHNAGIVNGRLAQFLVNFPSGKSTSAGNYARVSQVISNNGAVFPDAPYPFTFRVSGYPNTATHGYHQLQFLVDSTVVWSRDIASSYGVQDVITNLQPWLAGKTSATLTARVYDAAGVSSFFIRSSWILPGGPWVKTETGGFAGTSIYYPAGSNNIPMIVMLYDWMYGTGGNNNSNYIYNANVIAQNAVLAGQAAGIIQFQLDKSASSPLFPIIRQLYGQWAYEPQFTGIFRQANGSVTLTGTGGGPNIGYTLKAVTDPATPPESWVMVMTNSFSSTGAFTNTDLGAPGQPRRFYRISVP